MAAANLRDASIRRLPFLETRGRHIVVAESGTQVRLRGVNLSGLEYSEPGTYGFLKAAKISRAEVLRLTAMGCNILRVPFNQDWVLRGRGNFSGEDYLAAIDQVMAWAVEGGAYTLLDLQWLDADTPRGGDRQFVAPLPNKRSFNAWAKIAMRYHGCPCVLYDLFNEPHDRLPGDHIPLTHPNGAAYRLPWRRKVYPHNWKEWAVKLIDVIRQVHPLSVIFVSGTNWGYDLRKIKIPRANLVYSTHVYPDKRPSWDVAFGELSATEPVFVGEFGGLERDLEWGRRLLDFLDERELGWAAWSWRDKPHLQIDGTLTAFGELVAGRLRPQGFNDASPRDRSGATLTIT